jgi:hypothetical protein
MADALQTARHQLTRTRRGRNDWAPNANRHTHGAGAPWQRTTTPPSFGNLTDDPELRLQHRHRRDQPPGRRHPAHSAGRPVARWRDQLLQGQRLARPRRAPGRLPRQRRPGDGHPADFANAAGKPPRATSARSPNWRPMRSGPPSSGLRPRSSGPTSAATPTATRPGAAGPNAAATSTTPPRSERPSPSDRPSAPSANPGALLVTSQLSAGRHRTGPPRRRQL